MVTSITTRNLGGIVGMSLLIVLTGFVAVNLCSYAKLSCRRSACMLSTAFFDDHPKAVALSSVGHATLVRHEIALAIDGERHVFEAYSHSGHRDEVMVAMVNAYLANPSSGMALVHYGWQPFGYWLCFLVAGLDYIRRARTVHTVDGPCGTLEVEQHGIGVRRQTWSLDDMGSAELEETADGEGGYSQSLVIDFKSGKRKTLCVWDRNSERLAAVINDAIRVRSKT